MNAKKDGRLLEILNSYLEKQPAPGGNTDELDVQVSDDYMARCIDTLPDIPETAAESEIHSRTEALLNSFIGNAGSISFHADVADGESIPEAPAENDNMMCSEILANIFLRQHRYDRALEIIKSLYLNFPNKSVYFADQIRYLEKLVRINQIN